MWVDGDTPWWPLIGVPQPNGDGILGSVGFPIATSTLTGVYDAVTGAIENRGDYFGSKWGPLPTITNLIRRGHI